MLGIFNDERRKMGEINPGPAGLAKIPPEYVKNARKWHLTFLFALPCTSLRFFPFQGKFWLKRNLMGWASTGPGPDVNRP